MTHYAKCRRGESVFQTCERVMGPNHGFRFGDWCQRPAGIPEDWVLVLQVRVRAGDPCHGFYGPPAALAKTAAEEKRILRRLDKGGWYQLPTERAR